MADHRPSQHVDRIDWDLGTATSSQYDSDGFQAVQVDAFGEQDSGMPAAQQSHWYGFAARPLDPDDGGLGCQVLYAYQGEQHFAWVANDPRLQSKIPTLQKGGACVYDSHGSYWLFNPDDKTVRLVVPGDSGNSTLEVTDSKLTWQSPGGSAKIESQDSGTAVTGPFSTDQTTQLGGSGAVPLAKFTPLLTALQAMLVDIQAALAALSLTPTSTAAVSSFATSGNTTNTTAA